MYEVRSAGTPSTSVRTSIAAGSSTKARGPSIWTTGGDRRCTLASLFLVLEQEQSGTG
ncbi:hypothetical protein [Streptomyces albidoflavus]|uniref:hypothetical protein n=1 Tax=Streptomyces albidoflavus TaxID=1886 RepID=UPI0033D0BC86